MPEGDTVWRHARRLHEALAGTPVLRSEFRLPRLATTDVSGWVVDEVVSRGKHILLRLTAPSGAAYTLHSHLRMEGFWKVYAPGEPWRGRPAHQVRVVLENSSAVAVGYHLHEVALLRREHEVRVVGHLGPDLLGPDWDAAEAVRRLARDPDRQIADALIDQRNLAGIGNIYKAEILFLRGVWPWTPVRAVPDLMSLVLLARRLLTANQGRWTRSTTGSLRRGDTTYVYGRDRAPCRRCGTRVAKRGQGERVTYWCPRCQPPPRQTRTHRGRGSDR